jgi:hypothetical protein
MKKTLITAKPSQSARPADADAWVSSGQPAKLPAERMKRLTIDVTESLHRRIKVGCAQKGEDMADELRRILEQHFPQQS